ncbi:Uncharacterised protein [Mycobacteroides abscessus subsp. massiliense]|nr:Uncharacterised protein [Mycobacteroides abscessus subsp. massiliense]
MLSNTSGRNITAISKIVTLAETAISCKAGMSTANTEPNSKCSKSTLLPFLLTKTTPMARLLK